MTDNEEALNRKLYEKVSAEMEAYENELLAMLPEEILEHIRLCNETGHCSGT